MLKRFGVAAVVLSLSGAMGCSVLFDGSKYQGGTPGGSDAGPTGSDAGTNPGTDAGTNPDTDAGTTPDLDAGPDARDSGPDASPSAPGDAGPADGGFCSAACGPTEVYMCTSCFPCDQDSDGVWRADSRCDGLAGGPSVARDCNDMDRRVGASYVPLCDGSFTGTLPECVGAGLREIRSNMFGTMAGSVDIGQFPPTLLQPLMGRSTTNLRVAVPSGFDPMIMFDVATAFISDGRGMLTLYRLFDDSGHMLPTPDRVDTELNTLPPGDITGVTALDIASTSGGLNVAFASVDGAGNTRLNYLFISGDRFDVIRDTTMTSIRPPRTRVSSLAFAPGMSGQTILALEEAPIGGNQVVAWEPRGGSPTPIPFGATPMGSTLIASPDTQYVVYQTTMAGTRGPVWSFGAAQATANETFEVPSGRSVLDVVSVRNRLTGNRRFMAFWNSTSTTGGLDSIAFACPDSSPCGAPMAGRSIAGPQPRLLSLLGIDTAVLSFSVEGTPSGGEETVLRAYADLATGSGPVMPGMPVPLTIPVGAGGPPTVRDLQSGGGGQDTGRGTTRGMLVAVEQTSSNELWLNGIRACLPSG